MTDPMSIDWPFPESPDFHPIPSALSYKERMALMSIKTIAWLLYIS